MSFILCFSDSPFNYLYFDMQQVYLIPIDVVVNSCALICAHEISPGKKRLLTKTGEICAVKELSSALGIL